MLGRVEKRPLGGEGSIGSPSSFPSLEASRHHGEGAVPGDGCGQENVSWNKNGRRAEKLRAERSEVSGPGSPRVGGEGQLEGQDSAEGVGKDQKYQGRSRNIDQSWHFST